MKASGLATVTREPRFRARADTYPLDALDSAELERSHSSSEERATSKVMLVFRNTRPATRIPLSGWGVSAPVREESQTISTTCYGETFFPQTARDRERSDMMHIRPPFIGTVIAAGLFATFSQAQSLGEVTVMIAGAERTIPVWAEQSDWSGSEDWPSINIYVRDFPDNGEEPIVLSLAFEASRWELSVPEMELSLYENRERVAVLYGREEQERGGLKVNLDDHSIDGTRLSISGSFAGILGTSDNYGNHIDLSQGVPVTGTFDVTLAELD